MEKQRTVAHQLKITANKTTRLAEVSIPAEVRRDVTPVQSHIVGYLYHNRERALYQRDVEAEFSIGRATASKLLTAMERGGLIRRSAVAGDARLKKLELTLLGEQAHLCMEPIVLALDRKLIHGISPEELSAFQTTLEKLRRNVQASINQQEK